MTVALWKETPWTEDVADCPLARLAWELREKYRASRPAHLAVESLADDIGERYGLTVPVSFADAVRVLEDLDIEIEITRTTRNFHAKWEWEDAKAEFHCRMKVLLSDRDAETRQTLSLFHELYEILREYFHAFNCARFPPGLKREDYVCEEMARRFSAAVCLPRGYVRDFIKEHGLNIPLLMAQSSRSHGCVVRRLRDLLGGKRVKPSRDIRLEPGEKLRFGQRPQSEDLRHRDDLPLLGEATPFLCVRVGLNARLTHRIIPLFSCIELVRTHQISLRRNDYGARDYVIPRKGEEWTLGPIVEHVQKTRRSLFVSCVHGFDLLKLRDLCVLAVPELRGDHLVGVALYATLATDDHLWDPVLEHLDCDRLKEEYQLGGVPTKAVRPRRPEPRHGDLLDICERELPSGKVLEKPIYASYKTEEEKAEAERRNNAPVWEGQVQLLHIEEDALLITPSRGSDNIMGDPAS